MSWVKLERGNDWGHVYFALPGKRLDAHGGASLDLAHTFQEGERIHVRWPDGSETWEEVVHTMMTTEVFDHGRMHPDVVSSSLAGLRVESHGIKSWLPLDAVEIEVT